MQAADSFGIDDWWKYGPTYYDNETENFVMFDCRLDNGYYYRYFFYNHTSADVPFDLTFSFNGSALTVKSSSAYEIGYAFGWYDPSTGGANAGADNRYFTGSRDLVVWDYEDIDLDWYNFRYYAAGDSTVTLDGIDIEQYDYLYYTFPSLEYGPRGYVLPWCFSQYHVVYTQSNNNGGYEPPIFYMFTNNKNTYLSFRDSGSVIDYGLFSTDNSTVGGYSDVVVFHTSKPDYGDYTVARVNVGTWYELPLFGPDLGNVLYSELPVYLVEVSASDGSSGGSVDVIDSTNPQNATTDDIVENLEHLETVVNDSAQSVVDKVESSTVQITEKIDESTGKITYEVQESTEQIVDKIDDSTGAITDKIDESTDKITGSIDSAKDQAHQDSEDEKGLLRGIWDAITNLPGLIMDGLKGLFIPGDDFFSNLMNDLNDFFADKFGFLYAPFDYIIRFLNLLLTDVSTVGTVHFPGLTLKKDWFGMSKDMELIPEQDVAILPQNNFAGLIDTLHMITSIILSGALLKLAHDKYKEVIG